MKKLVSLLTALALTASMAVLPVFAEGEGDTTTDPETPVTTATAEPNASSSPEATIKPVAPLVPIEVTALPKGEQNRISFSVNETEAEEGEIVTTEKDGKTTKSWEITKNKKVGEYVAVYADADNKIVIDGSNKKFDNNTRTYSARIKLGGAVTFDTTEAEAPAIRTISVTPAESGTLVVDFAHASSSGDARTFVLYQNGKVVGTKQISANATDTIKAPVEANMPVYLYSMTSGINIYGIMLTDLDTSTPAPTPTAAPEVIPTPLPIGERIDFNNPISAPITSTTQYGNYLKVISNGSEISIDANDKTFDDRTYTTRIKFGGNAAVGSDGIPTNRALSVIPADNGTIRVDFANGSSNNGDRSLTASQSGKENVVQTVPQNETATLTMAVSKDIPVYLYPTAGSVNIYGIELIEGSTQPDSTASPSETAQPTTDKVSCTKIVATYASGALTNVTITPGEYTAEEIAGVTNTETEKTYYWKSLSGNGDMEPVKVSLPDPTATPEPEPEWGWVAANDATVVAEVEAVKADSSAARTVVKGYELISGLTTLFDNTSTNKAYIAGGAAGEWSEPDSTSEKYNKASMLKYVPTKDGVLYIKIDKLDAGKQAAIFEEGLSQSQIQNDPSYINAEKDLTNVIVKREVEAGKTYLVTVKGATGRYNAAAFVEQAVSKTWSGASKAENITAGTELFSGLTTLFADVSAADKKYISGDTNPTVDTETGEVTGSALQFVAPANGTISVTITGLGAGKSAAIYDKAAKTEIDTKTNDSTEKADVTLSATVEAGKTYYIMGKGTNACYSSASFTPAAEAPATTD